MSAVLQGRQVHHVLLGTKTKLVRSIVGPGSDERFLCDVRGNRHPLVGSRPDGVHVLPHRQTGFRLACLGIHEEDMSAQKGENDVILPLIEQQHMGTPYRLLGRFLTELIDLS